MVYIMENTNTTNNGTASDALETMVVHGAIAAWRFCLSMMALKSSMASLSVWRSMASLRSSAAFLQTESLRGGRGPSTR